MSRLNPCFRGLLVIDMETITMPRKSTDYCLNPCFRGLLVIDSNEGESNLYYGSLNPCFRGLLVIDTPKVADKVYATQES